MKPKHQCHLYQWEERVYGAQSWKERRLLHESMLILIGRRTLILKNSRKKSFSYETKASLSFILISKTSLRCLIMRKEEIITCICVYPNWQIRFDSKKWWEDKFFLLYQSINFIYPIEENEFMVPYHEKKKDYYLNSSIHRWTLILENGMNRSFFL